MKKKNRKWFDSAILREDESRTTENSRHFILNNGTRKAVFSQNTTNYFDKTTEKWSPIDGTLKTKGDSYVASIGKYTVRIPKESDHESVEVSNESGKISWEYLGNQQSLFTSVEHGVVKPGVKRRSKLSVKTEANDPMDLFHSGKVVFTGAEGNVDLDYLVDGSGVKENIVINDRSDSYRYYFLLRVSGFEVKTTQDGSQIEIYKPIQGEGEWKGASPEFTMPAPFMYDANGSRSEAVSYTLKKINDEQYLFVVNADETWINHSNRIFPVWIDPQLIMNSDPQIAVTHDLYQWCETCCESNTSSNAEWAHIGDPYYNYIYLGKSASFRTDARLHIKKSGIDFTRNELISVKLIFEKFEGEVYSDTATIMVGDVACTHNNELQLVVDITGLYSKSSNEFDIVLQLETNGAYRKFSKTPTLEVEYQPLYETPIRKNLSVEDGVAAKFDVLSGNATVVFDDIAEPILGVAVSHVYKPNDEFENYGKNFRLNLNEKLVSESNQYIYTDAYGDKHTFKEHFYSIGVDGKKAYITSDIGSITADAEGRLWKDGAEVFRELLTDRGRLRATSRLGSNVNDSEWVEQRIDEEKQAEEQAQSYKDTLLNFVFIDKDYGNICIRITEDDLSSPKMIDEYLHGYESPLRYLLTLEEALAYNPSEEMVNYQKSSVRTEQFKSYYKEYLNLKNQLETLKMQIPVSYLISDSIVKGFNAKGDLVVIQDKYGKYVVVDREKYDTSGKTRISAVYDQDSNAMTFAYNGKHQLTEICNSIGERVAFEYDESGYLIGMKRDNRSSLVLAYTQVQGADRISKISSSNRTSAELTYNLMQMLTGIVCSTDVGGISHDQISDGSETLSTFGAEYKSDETWLTYDSGRKEVYKFSKTTEMIKAHYELVDDKVSNVEQYTYENDLIKEIHRANKNCLNKYSYRIFDQYMDTEYIEQKKYDSFKNVIRSNKYRFAEKHDTYEDLSEVEESKYIYNDSQKLIEKKTTHSYCNDGQAYYITVTVEKYYYDTAGELVRRESYVDGEELKTGITIEEHVFNDKGVEIQSFTYNSLDPSSKFYTEVEVDEKGRTLAEFDESGEHKTAFEFERDGVTVKTECLPNGSKRSFGRDKDGSVTAITQSTEQGEENSTTQTRTLDVVTEIKSGNNTVRYTYDGKRRVTSVSLNGVDDYVTYVYSGEHTNAETVTATMQDGTVSTVVKNLHGNVISSTCGDRSVTNTYNTLQQLTKTVDSVSGETTMSYNDKGNITTVIAPDCSESLMYNCYDKMCAKTISGGGAYHAYTYAYKSTADKALDAVMIEGNTVRPNIDALGRNTGKTIEVGENKISEEKISYVKFGDHATNLPSTVRFATNGTFKESIQYRYDSMGNIIEIFENGRSACRYEYDALGRLTREDNVAFGKTTTWAYDNNGNILARYEYEITAKPTSELHLLDCACKLYTYDDNSDQLKSYNGEVFEYDVIGNPTTYRGKAATWAYGRQLTSYDGNTFSYDARGRRTAKNGITFTYDSNGNLIKQSNGLEFLYDHTGVFAVKYNGSTFFYRKDTLGNIVKILDNNGAVVVEYKYDAWGKCQTTVVDSTATEIANLNPFRYRSYYLDTETGFYFLKTRYYDSEIGRFITIDDLSYLDPESINGLNLYAYCGNNPILRVDSTGFSWNSFWENVGDWFGTHRKELIIGAAFIITGAIVSVLTCGAGTTIWAAFGAALLNSAIQVGVGIAISVGISGIVNVAQGASFFDNVGDTIANSFMWGGILSGGSQILSGAFRILKAKGLFTGISNSKIGLLSPDKLYYKQPGMTLLRIGNPKGVRIALDLGRYGIHAHILGGAHLWVIPTIVAAIEYFRKQG